MKKNILEVLSLVVALCSSAFLFACGPEKADEDKAEDITYSLTYSAGEGGRILGEQNQTIKKGQNGVSVVALASEGYYFYRWSDGKTFAERQDFNVTHDISVTAEFQGANQRHPSKEEYKIEYLASVGGHITGPKTQNVQDDDEGEFVTAVADAGYEFSEWSDGVTAARRRDVHICNDFTVTAYFNDLSAQQFVGGNGTEQSPYLIKDEQQLKNIKKYPNAFFKLAADITFTRSFPPLFMDNKKFEGVLDGAGHKLERLKIETASSYYSSVTDPTLSAGLFAYIGEEGKVKNLIIENAKIDGIGYVGAIAGYSLGSITDCTVSGTVAFRDGKRYSGGVFRVYLGGIVGRAEGEVNRCHSNVEIICEDNIVESYVGGIVGCLAPGQNPTDLISTGNVTVTSRGGCCVGGLMGEGGGTLINCYSTGNVSAIVTDGYFCYVGGLMGEGGGTLINCYSTGNISGNAKHCYVGGLMGEGGGTLINCYSTGSISATASTLRLNEDNWINVGGLVGYGGGIFINCYSTGKIAVINEKLASDDTLCIGGFIGNGSSTIKNSYSVSLIKIESDGDDVVRAGAFVGEGDVTFENAHWLYYKRNNVDHAVGYLPSMNMGEDCGALRYTSITAFYNLAETLNQGLDDPAWENKGENSLPTLIDKEQKK